jgi:hypothetical protein
MKSETKNLMQTIQASMVESSRPCFEEPGQEHLCYLIKLTMEFNDYLQHGIPELRDLMEHNQHRFDGDLLSFPESNELQYSIESIFSGIEAFCSVNAAYNVLIEATDSEIEQSIISVPWLKKKFTSTFRDFVAEPEFKRKCRLLLDLFKMQIIFAGILV